MRYLMLLCLLTVGCATQPQKGFDLPPALREVYRGGELTPMQQAQRPDLGIPKQYDLVSHTCVSTPMYDLDGNYSYTDTQCF